MSNMINGMFEIEVKSDIKRILAYREIMYAFDEFYEKKREQTIRELRYMFAEMKEPKALYPEKKAKLKTEFSYNAIRHLQLYRIDKMIKTRS